VATSAGEVEVKLTLNAGDFKQALGDSTKGVNQFSQAIDVLGRQLLTVFSFAAVSSFFKDSMAAYGENQVAVVKLTNAMQNQGIATEENISRVEAYAEALAQSTGISKVAIIDSQAFLTTFGLQGQKMDQATLAALNMSKAMGIDLHSATLLLGKAFDGVTGSLARYGIIIDKNLDPTQRFQAVLDQINARFGGVALAVADTYTGRIAKMGEAFRALQVQVGEFLAGSGGGVVAMMTNLIKIETNAFTAINNATTALGGFGNVMKVVGIELLRIVMDSVTKILNVMIDMMPRLPLMGNAIDSLHKHVNDLNTSLNNEINQWQVSAQAAMQSSAKKVTSIQNTKAAHVDYLTTASMMEKDIALWQTNRTLMDAKEFQDSLAVKHSGFDKFASAFTLSSDNMWLQAGKSAKQVTDAFAKGMAEVIVKGKDFHDTMVAIWQDIEMQVIEYIIKMITKELILLALESATGTLGMGSGGGMGGAPSVFSGFDQAFASGGVISEPSVIVGLQSGSRTLAGEAGPEMVSPMNGGDGSGKGGNITINISGQLIEGNAASWRQLVNQQIIPAIRRYSMSNPTGPFNRTRGVV
jgi:hypothetical protein